MARKKAREVRVCMGGLGGWIYEEEFLACILTSFLLDHFVSFIYRFLFKDGMG